MVRAYTLIELLVSIAILAMLTALVAPSLGSGRRAHELDQAAQIIKEKVIEAQSFALAPPQDNNGAIGYGVEIFDSGVPIKLHMVRCTALPVNSTNCTVVPNTDTIIQNIRFVGSTTNANKPSVFFKIGNRQDVETNIINSKLEIRVGTSGGDNRVIYTSPGNGAIYVND